MPDPRVAWVIVGGPGAAADRSREAILAGGAAPAMVAVAPAGDPSPWRVASSEADAVRLLHAGDLPLAEGGAALIAALSDGAAAAVSGHRVRAPGRWGDLVGAPDDLAADRLVLDCPLSASCLLARPKALAEAEPVPPDAPGGTAVLLAGLAARVGLVAVAEPAAVVRGAFAAGLPADPREELAAARTVLASAVGAAAGTAGALRRRMLELAFLDPAGPLDVARDPAALWGDLPQRGGPEAIASVLTELHDALFALAERTRWSGVDLSTLPSPPPDVEQPDLAAELARVNAELIRMHHLMAIADERDLWHADELAALQRQLAAARGAGAPA